MTSDINIQIAASQRTASSASKAQEAVASEQVVKPDPNPKIEAEVKTEERQELSAEQLNEAVEQLNTLAQSVRRELSFSVDDDSGRTVITVRDKETEEVVRQIPSEEALSLISRFQKFESGLLEEMV